MKEKVKKTNRPLILYVEGQDQFRGWFNSSLITAVILTGQPPYQQVLSHGFVVDEKGRKMSKSLGNVIDPEDIMANFGADILRLWVVSCDFTKEIKVSLSILENLRESYRKIRNTFRFLLGNLANLPPTLQKETDLTPVLSLVDCYLLHQLEKLLTDSQKNYNNYNFNPIYSSLLNFCINDLSAFYFEISKDSLYCDSLTNPRRNQIITTLYYLLWGLLKIISPILPFLAEEVYQNIPLRFGFANAESVHLINWPPKLDFSPGQKKEIRLITDYFFPLRNDVYQLLEKARRENIVTTNSQASLLVHVPKNKNLPPEFLQLNLTELLMVAEIRFSPKLEKDWATGKFCSLHLEKTQLKRCRRCWNYREKAKDLCERCQKILRNE